MKRRKPNRQILLVERGDSKSTESTARSDNSSRAKSDTNIIESRHAVECSSNKDSVRLWSNVDSRLSRHTRDWSNGKNSRAKKSNVDMRDSERGLLGIKNESPNWLRARTKISRSGSRKSKAKRGKPEQPLLLGGTERSDLAAGHGVASEASCK